MGVTIYWFVRNDWIANYVQVIGNDEWELRSIFDKTFFKSFVEAIKSRKVRSKDFLSTWNIYDEKGINVAEGLREIGKVYRTKFILRYMMDKELQQDIREGCNRAEFWNKFQDAVFWGKEGVISSNCGSVLIELF